MSISQHPTNQIVEKFNVGDAIWLVKKTFVMLTMLVVPASYCEPILTCQVSLQIGCILFAHSLYMSPEMFARSDSNELYKEYYPAPPKFLFMQLVPWSPQSSFETCLF